MNYIFVWFAGIGTIPLFINSLSSFRSDCKGGNSNSCCRYNSTSNHERSFWVQNYYLDGAYDKVTETLCQFAKLIWTWELGLIAEIELFLLIATVVPLLATEATANSFNPSRKIGNIALHTGIFNFDFQILFFKILNLVKYFSKIVKYSDLQDCLRRLCVQKIRRLNWMLRNSFFFFIDWTSICSVIKVQIEGILSLT